MSKNSGSFALPIGVAAALVVSCLWTVLTGGIWHWIPVLGGIAVALGAAKAVNSGQEPGPPKRKGG